MPEDRDAGGEVARQLPRPAAHDRDRRHAAGDDHRGPDRGGDRMARRPDEGVGDGVDRQVARGQGPGQQRGAHDPLEERLGHERRHERRHPGVRRAAPAHDRELHEVPRPCRDERVHAPAREGGGLDVADAQRVVLGAGRAEHAVPPAVADEVGDEVQHESEGQERDVEPPDGVGDHACRRRDERCERVDRSVHGFGAVL